MLHPDQWVIEEKDDLVPLDKWQKTVDVMARIFQAPAGFIVQYRPKGYQVVIASDQESNPYPAGVEITPDTNIFCKKVVQEGHELYVKNAQTDPTWDTNPEVADDGFSSYLGLPVQWPSGEPFGTICVMDFESTDYRSEYLDLVSEFRDLIEADLRLLSQYEEISNLAMTDELTGLYNRRGFMSVATHYSVLAKRTGISLGLLYLDLDDLKGINDQQGHSSGDQALKHLAEAIRGAIRENDISARMSGDEFVVLAAAETQADLEKIAERINQNLKKNNLGVSIGSVILQGNQAIEYWLEQADSRMYQDKSG
ncbi:diguanylate cyclase [Neptuniibacter sp. QD72_48]|uniref:sensor domain-containing diguanylate cyclase n=1 Tax=unclassified Neptuniibacter TaxID=2630693 RepID=UPI0039F622B3